MRKVATKNYLIIGCVHLGISKSVLALLAELARHHNADVIHLGSLLTEDEIKMYRRRMGFLRTWEKWAQEAIERGDERRAGTLLCKHTAAEDEVARIMEAQQRRMDKLNQCMGKVSFVVNDEQAIDVDAPSHMVLGRYLRLDSVHPNGMKVSGDPLSEVALTMLRRHSLRDQHSVIVPHPTSRLVTHATPGVNNAFSYISTGCLFETQTANRPSERHKAVNMPGAVFVSLDQESGEYHASRVVFARDRHRKCLMCAIDDEVFTRNGVEAPAEKHTASFDPHAPYHCRRTQAAIWGFNGLSKPNTHILGGDVGDMRPVCPHITNNLLEREGMRLGEALDALRDYIYSLRLSQPVRWLRGNHEKWLDGFIEKNPMLQGLLDWDTLAAKWCVETINDNGPSPALRIGDGTIRHGHQEGSIVKGAKLFESYVCGHGHRRDEWGRAYMAPASANEEDLTYTDGAVGRSVNGFLQLSVQAGRLFVTPHVVLWRGKDASTVRFSYRGQIWETEV